MYKKMLCKCMKHGAHCFEKLDILESNYICCYSYILQSTCISFVHECFCCSDILEI